MKITLDIPDGIIAGFFNGVEVTAHGMQKLGKIAAKSCPCCGEQEEGLWRLLGRAEGFEGTVFTEESDED